MHLRGSARISFPLPKLYANVCIDQCFFDAQQNANAARYCTSGKNRSTSAALSGAAAPTTIIRMLSGLEPFQDDLAEHSSAFDGRVGLPKIFRTDTTEVLRDR